jgi:hypothetical protein
MEDRKVDVDLTLRVLNNFNAGKYDHFRPVEVESIPEVDGRTVVDMTGNPLLTLPRPALIERLEEFGVTPEAVLPRGRTENSITLDREKLRQIGTKLLPLLSYGILNGGSATSYADRKKNRGFSEPLFSLLEPHFERMAELSSGRAKGITPGFIHPDGTPGPSFIELKMRALLIQSLSPELATEREVSGGDHAVPGLPMFQMTSISNNEEVALAYSGYRSSPLLRDLIRETGLDPTRTSTGVQPLMAAFTHSRDGRPKGIFDRANGKLNSAIPLPGGHGQNFAVLRTVYEELRKKGKRFVSLGNVDNLGYTPDPVELAYLALTGKQAGFDFAFRTPVDVKGGILVRDRNGGMTCADIGPAISTEEMLKAEESGSGILFNCASGLFDLDYLVANIDRIVENLPTRFSDQDKDSGSYSQAEQVTWEILGMLDDFLVFGVEKWNRFLAAKLLMETLMTSGVGLEDPRYPTSDLPAKDLRGTARKLHDGLTHQLETVYGMRLANSRWEPVPPDELSRSRS